VSVTEQQRLILDVDTGIDDALAILYALNRPGIKLEAITTTHGNIDVASATRNSLQVLELAGRPDVPVYQGASRSLARPYTKKGSRVHGENGLGNVTLPAPAGMAEEEHAVDFLIRMARENPGQITLVPTGPLTNVALMCLQAPDAPRLFREIVIMGGAVLHPGNVNALAEANIWNDPEAARLVFHSGARIKLVGLDVTMQTLFTPAMMAEIGALGDAAAASVVCMSEYYLGAYREFYPGIGGCALHDPLAVAVAEDPSLVRTQPMFVDVECTGELTRGLTFADRRKVAGIVPNMDVCLEVDAERFGRCFLEALVRRHQSEVA
jgi:purine nucleosidase